jgi:hypothetical protein
VNSKKGGSLLREGGLDMKLKFIDAQMAANPGERWMEKQGNTT